MTERTGNSVHKYLFHQGRDFRSYEYFGAHSTGDGEGIRFRVWAPRAESVSVVGDFNGWDPSAAPMKRLHDDSSIWETVLDNIHVGDLYKYVVGTDDGRLLYKADPYAFESEKGSAEEGGQKASRVSDIAWGYQWKDRRWMEERRGKDLRREPVNIYEVHLGSWKHGEAGGTLTYRQIADELIPYARKMGYTHIELLPIMEYPYDGSWGYQVTGYYSVTSRYGKPEDFMYLVETAHKNRIGVIMDWVPAHFPKDAHGLIEFDGHPLYEDSDPLRMEYREWDTRAFDLGRKEVMSFLISSAFFYFDVYHVDGLRVDAVAAMLYLDYGRKEGEWQPNRKGGRENLEAVNFLQNLNKDVLTAFPGAIMAAEESTDWPMVTKPPEMGGLGFNFKWNMGWMNDSLEYFQTDPLFRSGIHNKLTFSITYAYSENYILPISHDEVVHGKKSLLDKMPGEYDQKFAGLRAFYIYMMTHPGKKLLFMGCEFGQFIEWDEKRELDWMLLDYDRHRQIQEFVKKLNHFYRRHSALWKRDDAWEGYTWIDADNAPDNTFSYYRTDDSGERPRVEVVILNLSGKDFPEYDIGVPFKGRYERTLDSDDIEFGGRGLRTKKSYSARKGSCNGLDQHITVELPALSGMILSWRAPARKKSAVGKDTAESAAGKK